MCSAFGRKSNCQRCGCTIMVALLPPCYCCIGGGKDEVLKYLNESKKQVIQAKASLEKIMDALEIKP